MATSSKADISETENVFRIFYYVSEIYVKFRVFWKKLSVSNFKYYGNYLLRNMQLLKCPKDHLSCNASADIMLTGPKHC